MLVATLVSALLVAATIFLHFKVLKLSSKLVFAERRELRWPMLFVIAIIFIAHILEVILYSFAYLIMETFLGVGSLTGALGPRVDNLSDLFYFSIASYTTLGIGDILPEGPLRIVAGVESLNGLVLIAWSSSFTYLMMERLWGGNGNS